MKTDDAAKVEEALKKMPEWGKLNTELEEATRKATTKIVGKRIAPKKPVSK